MKRVVCVFAAMGLMASLMVGGTLQAAALSVEETAVRPAVTEEENSRKDDWKRAESPELTRMVDTVFRKAFDGLTGASYTPVALLATRTTASGTQYRLLCRRTLVYPGAEETYVVATLSRNWLGRAKLLDVGDALAPTELAQEDETLLGGWQEAESPVMTEEATEAFQKATEMLLGAHYEPVALLSTQVVAGTNYRILCEETPVYPGAEMHYVVMTVYQDLEGNASILSISDSLASEAAQ